MKLRWPAVVHVLVFVTSIARCQTLLSEWPEFRGPGGQGHATATQVPTRWAESQNVGWKVPLPGRGHSSPVVLGDQIWLTTAIESKQEGASQTEGSELQHKRVSFHALCLDRRTGNLVHDVELFVCDDVEPIASQNTFASPTPVIEPGHAYFHFGRYGTACLATDTAKVLWTRTFAINHSVGPGSSPVLCGNMLVLTCDGIDTQFVVAVDKHTGNTVWSRDRPPVNSTNPEMKKSFCTPLIAHLAGRDQLIIPAAQWFVSYEPATGEEIWRVDYGPGCSVVPRPVCDERCVYCCTGYMFTELLSIRGDGLGDVTKSHVEWRTSQLVPTQPSPLLNEGMLYLISDTGVAQCLDASTGKQVWKRRIGGNFSASPLWFEGQVAFFNNEGITTIVSTDAEGTVLSKNELEDGIFATPAILSGQIIIRTASHLYSIKNDSVSK